MPSKQWFFPACKSQLALILADISLFFGIVCIVVLFVTLNISAWLGVAICWVMRWYFKTECWSFSFVMKGSAIGYQANGEVPMRFARPALITPYCIWFLVKRRNSKPQWILVWKDQFHPRNWRRLRRIAHDLNH